MSRVLTMTHAGAAGFGERRKTGKSQPVPPSGIGRVTLNFLLVVLICASGVFYIFEVNNVATKGYEIRSMEKELQKMRDSNEQLRIREAELRSMYNIEERTRELNMSAPKDVSYLTLPGDMAMR